MKQTKKHTKNIFMYSASLTNVYSMVLIQSNFQNKFVLFISPRLYVKGDVHMMSYTTLWKPNVTFDDTMLPISLLC